MDKRVEYSGLKEHVINSLKISRSRGAIASLKEKDLKEAKERELKIYKDVKYNELLEAQRAVKLEQYNNSILKQEREIQKCDLYERRIVAYLNCMHFELNGDNEKYVESLKKLEEIIGEEVFNYYNNEIKSIRQKRVLYKNEESYIEILRKSNPNALKNFKRETTDEEFEADITRQGDIEAERKIAENVFGSLNLQISLAEVDTMTILDDDPIRVAKVACPKFKDKILEYQERSYSGKKVG